MVGASSIKSNGSVIIEGGECLGEVREPHPSNSTRVVSGEEEGQFLISSIDTNVLEGVLKVIKGEVSAIVLIKYSEGIE